MSEIDWSAWVSGQLAGIDAAGRRRTLREVDGPPSATFAANDYLGLTQHPAVLSAAHQALHSWGTGAGAARLTVGSRPVHTELETALAAWKGTDAALVFPSGYATNLGVLSALGGSEVRILSDALNHASIVDGCRLSGSLVEVYRHGDAGHVEDLLAGRTGARLGGARSIVVTETVFSMDGDVAPVDDLAAACRRHGALLVVDEAHAVLGPHPDLADVEHLRVGTLSKTLASMGGFVAGSRRMIDLLVNRARPFMFTTALAPVSAAVALDALEIVRSPEGDALVARLRTNVDKVRPGHPSPIVAVVLGSEEAAVAAAGTLAEMGLVVPAIRPPTVPVGTSRLRVTLSAAHTDAQIEALVSGLAVVTA